MDRPASTNDMTSQDDTVYQSRPVSGSEAAKSNEAIIAEANNAKMSGDDPLAGRGILQEEDIPGFVPGKAMPGVHLPGVKLTGTIDPIYGKSGLTIGDRIYHKKKHIEGTVKDMMASGKVVVELDNGKTGTTDASNLAKL